MKIKKKINNQFRPGAWVIKISIQKILHIKLKHFQMMKYDIKTLCKET